jgi:hypothetical protein
MISFTIALITVAFLCAGGLFGSLLRDRLPDYHIRDDSRDVVKTASAMIATLVALVIGLLVSSAKSSFDQASEGLTQVGTKVILMDRTLRRYGPETTPIRARMREVVQASIERLWPSGGGPKEGMAAVERGTELYDVQDMIERLAPKDEVHGAVRTQALQACSDLLQSRWLTIERAQTALPTPLLVLLIFWLTVLFTSLGLLAPRNLTTVSCLFVCAVSMAGALFLLMEMNRPFEGMIQVSPAPLLKALWVVGR